MNNNSEKARCPRCGYRWKRKKKTAPKECPRCHCRLDKPVAVGTKPRKNPS